MLIVGGIFDPEYTLQAIEGLVSVYRLLLKRCIPQDILWIIFVATLVVLVSFLHNSFIHVLWGSRVCA